MSKKSQTALKVAILNARAAMLNARISGMTAENIVRQAVGGSPAYNEMDFVSVMKDCKLADLEDIEELMREELKW